MRNSECLLPDVWAYFQEAVTLRIQSFGSDTRNISDAGRPAHSQRVWRHGRLGCQSATVERPSTWTTGGQTCLSRCMQTPTY